jgi:hypothetical protein
VGASVLDGEGKPRKDERAARAVAAAALALAAAAVVAAGAD